MFLFFSNREKVDEGLGDLWELPKLHKARFYSKMKPKDQQGW